MKYSKSLAYQWTLYLDSRNYSYRFDTENGVFIIPEIKVNRTLDAVSIYIAIRESDFEVRCVFPRKAATNFIAQIAQLLIRINCTISFGSFYMDYSDGEIGYKYAADFEDSIASEQMLHNAMRFAASMMGQWSAAIMDVSLGKIAPKNAFLKYN